MLKLSAALIVLPALLVSCGPKTVEDTALPDINSRPIADAGSDSTLSADDAASLDGRGSYDPDGDPLTVAPGIACGFRGGHDDNRRG